MSEDTRILIVDDQPANIGILTQALEPQGYKVLTALTGESALKIAPRAIPDLILLDVMMPGIDGFDVCRRLQADESTCHIPIIFVTAKGEMKDIIHGFQLGGVDYIQKPFQEIEVLARVKTHLRISQLTRELMQKNGELEQEIESRTRAEIAKAESDEELSYLSAQEKQQWGIEGFIGKSPTVADILDKVRQLQGTGTTSVLITGESGTGKELIARAIHFGGSRATGRFVPLNCSAIPSELVESTLFGHVRGAFTGASVSRKGCFERADGGTLFLDEIGDMPYALQPKLLRVLDSGTFTPVGGEEKTVDVRVIAATNANLHAKIRTREFREDLYFRLAGFSVEVPPLRARREDVPLLTNHFLTMFATEMGRSPKTTNTGLSKAALDALMGYDFPGNVRELKNIIEHALILSGSGMIQREHLHFISPQDATQLANRVTTPQSPPTNLNAPAVSIRPQTEEDLVLAYVKANSSINNAECRCLFDTDSNHASYLLKKMHKAGILRREGGGRSVRYYQSSEKPHLLS